MEEVLDFWFRELTRAQWFKKDPSLDARMRDRFGELLREARSGELAHWRSSARGRLAEIIVLDQFPRNIHRGHAEAFSSDGMALVLSQEFVRGGHGPELSPEERAFAYMPHMHSESRRVHQEAVKLFSERGLEDRYRYELLHKEIIDRFGRYPSRNRILGRASTAEEETFLETHPGF